jgi:hypothetical protein
VKHKSDNEKIEIVQFVNERDAIAYMKSI